MQFLRRIRARIRYLFDRAFDREFAAQLGLFVLLVCVVTLAGMTAIFLAHPAHIALVLSCFDPHPEKPQMVLRRISIVVAWYYPDILYLLLNGDC